MYRAGSKNERSWKGEGAKTILFLVTASRNTENYHANDPERMPGVIGGVERLQPTAEDLGV